VTKRDENRSVWLLLCKNVDNIPGNRYNEIEMRCIL